MKEIEVKILEIDAAEVRRKLVGLGARRTYAGPVVTVYLDTDNERLKRHDESLRVRQIGDSVKVCYKGRNQSRVFKSREEIEVVTSDLEDTVALLERLGFVVQKKRTKRRESYRIGNAVFDIDKYPRIPALLEVEAPSQRLVAQFVRRLGYSMSDATNMSLRELEEYYNKK